MMECVKLFRVGLDTGRDQRQNRARFGKYSLGLGSLFERELVPEPVSEIVVVAGIPLPKLKRELHKLDYSRFMVTSFSRGEDYRTVKDTKQDPVWGMLPDRRRHLKCWKSETDNQGIIAITAHDEPAPLCLLRTLNTLKAHFNQGQGDYDAGTKGFFEELSRFLREQHTKSVKILEQTVDTVMEGLRDHVQHI